MSEEFKKILSVMPDTELRSLMDTVEAEVRRRNVREGVGATNTYPDEKLRDDDEGALAMSMTKENGNVFMNFGKAVSWLALPPEEARRLAAMLIKHADA